MFAGAAYTRARSSAVIKIERSEQELDTRMVVFTKNSFGLYNERKGALILPSIRS